MTAAIRLADELIPDGTFGASRSGVLRVLPPWMPVSRERAAFHRAVLEAALRGVDLTAEAYLADGEAA